MLLGASGSGKTFLMFKLLMNSFGPSFYQTIAISPREIRWTTLMLYLKFLIGQEVNAFRHYFKFEKYRLLFTCLRR